MARENPIDVIIILGAIAGGIYYKDEIIQFLKDKLGNPKPTGQCPAGQHKNSAGQCVPDVIGCTKTCTGNTHLDTASCTCVPNDTTPTTGKWYKANSTEAAMPRVRCSTSKCGAGSGNSGGNRWENEVKGFFQQGFEVVVYFKIKPGSMCSGGHIGLKHGGPNHTSPCEYSFSGSCCCWWDTGIDNDQGKAYVEIERPHPHNLNRKYFASVGTKLDSGQPIGFRWHISKEGSGIRLIGWIDTSGQVGGYHWREVYNTLDTGQFMPKDYLSHITNLQNIEIRISDVACGDITMLQGPSSKKIISGGTSGLAPDLTTWNWYENFRLA